jgi:hypothetical protein
MGHGFTRIALVIHTASEFYPNQLKEWEPENMGVTLPGCLRRAALLVGVLLLIPIQTGCLCLSIGGGGCHAEAGEHGTFTQTGSVGVQKGQEIEVYYPVPFASPPNLQIDDMWNTHVVIEQTATHFRIRNDTPIRQVFGGASVDWTARGIRDPATVPAIPAASVAPVTVVVPAH